MPYRERLASLRNLEAQACELGDASGDSAIKAFHFKTAEEYAVPIATLEREIRRIRPGLLNLQ